MATSVTTARATSRAVSTERAVEIPVDLPNRREFLYHIWGASVLLLSGALGAGLIWFALPRFKEGTFGGVFSFAPDRLPEPNAAPVSIPEGRFHVVHVEDGVNVLYGVCTHLGCLPKWNDQEERFLCPCHGSQFARDGAYLAGPAPRSLDRFETTVTFADGTSVTSSAIGDPIPVAGKTVIGVAINTGKKINRGSKN